MSKFFATVICAVGLTLAGGNLPAQSTSDSRQSREPGQRPTREESKLLELWLKGHGQLYENFFQASGDEPEDDVAAALGEVGASLRLSRNIPLRAWASYNYLAYDDERLDSSNGVRVGLRLDGRPHAFSVYAEKLTDRPSFDVGDEFDRADVRNLVGEYSYRFADDWQASIDGELQEQELELTPTRDSEFGALGAAIRWRAYRRFSPEIGVMAGDRDVVDSTLSYGQRDVYLQIRSSVTPEIYLSARYRDRRRDYSADVLESSNFGREDIRRQIAVSADWRVTQHLTWNFYGARENTDTNLEERDFDTSLYVLGLTWNF